MNSLSRALTLALAALLASAPNAAAQEARAGARKLGVTIVFDNGASVGPLEVPETANDDAPFEAGPPPKIPGSKRPEGEPPLTLLRLRMSREGDAVRTKVSVVFDDRWPADAPGPKYGAKEKPVGSYLAREGETVRVGLKDFGLTPVSLVISEAEPEPALPSGPAPARAVSRAKSIEVVSLLSEGAQMDRARLVVRNISAKNVVALVFEAEGYIRTEFAAHGRVLVESGATYEAEFNSTRRGAEPDTLKVTAALFADGSYDGDVRAAAGAFAGRAGRSTQFARILKLVRAALDEPDARKAVALLKEQIVGMRIDIEPALLDEMLAKFPALDAEDGRTLLAQTAMEGFRNARGETLSTLEDLEQEQTNAGGPEPRRILEQLRDLLEGHYGPVRD